jgi:two-component system, chemotaxis family, protein-glutamate methylesterase/glutaminase
VSFLEKKYDAVVIGTSAGGFNTLSSLLEQIPEHYCVPIVVVQHRSKNSGGLLEELLQQKCRVRIKQVDEKEAIDAGTVYIAPPDYHVLVEGDRTFSLSADSLVRLSRPSIDVLFESAAIVYRDALIGIILTGASDDGALGITAIAEYGGLTIAQHPEEAQFPFMVQASIDTKKIDHIWSLATIHSFLIRICNKK